MKNILLILVLFIAFSCSEKECPQVVCDPCPACEVCPEEPEFIKASWESSGHKNAKEWTKIAYNRLKNANENYSKGKDFLSVVPEKMNDYDVNFASKDEHGRIGTYVAIMSCMSKYESYYRPHVKYAEGGSLEGVTSRGLLQVSEVSCKGYGTPIKKGIELHGTFENLDCASRIFARWIKLDKTIYGRVNNDWKGLSNYWSVQRKSTRVKQIKECVKATLK